MPINSGKPLQIAKLGLSGYLPCLWHYNSDGLRYLSELAFPPQSSGERGKLDNIQKCVHCQLVYAEHGGLLVVTDPNAAHLLHTVIIPNRVDWTLHSKNGIGAQSCWCTKRSKIPSGSNFSGEELLECVWSDWCNTTLRIKQ